MNLEREPAQIIGYVTAAVAAVISLLIAYGIDISDDQRQAWMAVTSILAPAIAGVIIRFNVWSPAHTQEVADKAAQTGKAPQIV